MSLRRTKSAIISWVGSNIIYHKSNCVWYEVLQLEFLFCWFLTAIINYRIQSSTIYILNAPPFWEQKLGERNRIQVYKRHSKIAILKSGYGNKKYRNLITILLKIASWKAKEITRNTHIPCLCTNYFIDNLKIQDEKSRLNDKNKKNENMYFLLHSCIKIVFLYIKTHKNKYSDLTQYVTACQSILVYQSH